MQKLDKQDDLNIPNHLIIIRDVTSHPTVRALLEACQDDLKRNGILSARAEDAIIHAKRQLELTKEAGPETKQLIRELSSFLTSVIQTERSQAGTVGFNDIFGRFTDKQIDIIGPQIAIIELTKGCSVACPNCNFNALIRKGPQMKLDVGVIDTLLDRVGSRMYKDIMLYYASDPLDWHSEDSSYLGLLQRFADQADLFPETTTAIPVGKEEFALELWRSPFKVRISISDINFTRLQKHGFISGGTFLEIQESLGPPGCKESCVIGAYDFRANGGKGLIDTRLPLEVGKSYDYASYQPSIGCQRGVLLTTEGIFNTYSSATTPLSPNGYIKEILTPSSPYALVAEYDRHDRCQLSNLKAVSLSGQPIKTVALYSTQIIDALYRLIGNFSEVNKENSGDTLEISENTDSELRFRDFDMPKNPQREALVMLSSLRESLQFELEGNESAYIPEKLLKAMNRNSEDIAQQFIKFQQMLKECSLDLGNLSEIVSRVQEAVFKTTDARAYFEYTKDDNLPPEIDSIFEIIWKSIRFDKGCATVLSEMSSFLSSEDRAQIGLVSSNLAKCLEPILRIWKSTLEEPIKRHQRYRSDVREILASQAQQQVPVRISDNLTEIAILYRDEPALERSLKLMLESDLLVMGHSSVQSLAISNLAALEESDIDDEAERIAANHVIFANALVLDPHSDFISQIREKCEITNTDFENERKRLLKDKSVGL